MRFETLGVLLPVALWIAGIIGWVLNCIAIGNTYQAEITGLFVLRVVGIFVYPLGAVLGIFF